MFIRLLYRNYMTHTWASILHPSEWFLPSNTTSNILGLIDKLKLLANFDRHCMRHVFSGLNTHATLPASSSVLLCLSACISYKIHTGWMIVISHVNTSYLLLALFSIRHKNEPTPKYGLNMSRYNDQSISQSLLLVNVWIKLHHWMAYLTL